MITAVAHIVSRLADRLRTVPVGELVTHKELSDAIGQDWKSVMHALYQARQQLSRDEGIVFESKYRKGYRRLPNEELVKIGQTARSRVRRTARRANTEMQSAMRNINDLNDESRVAILREQSILGVLEMMSKDKALPEVAVTEVRPLTPAQTAQQFLDRLGAKRR